VRRRLCVLFALVALASAILAGSDDSAQARARRRKVRRRPPPPATAPVPPPETTPTDLIPRRLLILGFDGKGAQVARGATIDRLRKVASLNLVPLPPAEALRIGTAYGAGKTVDLAKRLNLTAVLYGEVTTAKRNVHAKLFLANGEDGEIVGEMAFDGRSAGALRTKIRAQIWAQLEPLIDRAASPGPREPADETPAERPPQKPPQKTTESPPQQAPEKPAAKPPERPARPRVATSAPPPPRVDHLAEPPKTPGRPGGESETAEGAPQKGDGDEETPGQEPTGAPIVLEPKPQSLVPPARASIGIVEEAPPARCSMADVEPGAGAMFRRFNYRDEQRGALRGYTLYRAPAAQIEGSVYPFGRGRCGLVSGIGLRFGYGRMAPVTSTLADRTLATQASDYQAELVLRIARGALTVQPAIGYFARQYTVEAGVVPDVAYRAIGASVDAALRIRFISIELGAGARRLLGAGTLESADWFPGAGGFALAGRARVGVAVNRWIDVLAGASAEYESFNLNIVDGAPYPNGVAAGAYDLYLQAGLAVRLRLGLGAGSGAGP
jgi:hypothetical protein